MLKSGSMGRWWHAAHILLSILTGGLWLIAYGFHALISVLTRPTIAVEVPPGGRVEYYQGHPQVLMPDEYLDKPLWPRLAPWLAGGAIAVALVTIWFLAR